MKTLAAVALAALFPLGSVAADKAPEAPAAKEAAKAPKPEPCVASASRIKPEKGKECAKSAAPTRTITREEIQQTGETDMSQALRKLDPRFQ
ncbi:MAG: hypothetical protein ABW136_07880 [Steroidobacteraceae bacterium]